MANARRLVGRLQERGHRIVSGGTDNHVFLLDVAAGGLTGKVAEKALGKAGLTVNKNTIPFDTKKALVASGVRIGTPAVTTRQMKEPQMDQIGDFIAEVLAASADDEVLADARRRVEELCEEFPLYESLP